MAKLPPLARSVYVGSTGYRAGDTPPLHHARKITNPKNWEGGKVPEFDEATDGANTAAGASPSEAVNTQPAGLGGFNTGSDGTGNEGAGSDEADTDAEADPAPAKAPARKATAKGTTPTR